MTRHIGRHATTDEQIVVVWMLIPDQTTHALAVYPDKVTDSLLRRELLEAVGSVEAQRSETLADAIGRRQYADTQKSILQVLHERSALERLPIDDILMTPDGNHRVALRTVLEAIGKLGATTPVEPEKFNPHTFNTTTEGANEQVGIARNLIAEAEMLEADARHKRAQAYQIAPSLNPVQATPAPAPEAAAEPAAETSPTPNAE